VPRKYQARAHKARPPEEPPLASAPAVYAKRRWHRKLLRELADVIILGGRNSPRTLDRPHVVRTSGRLTATLAMVVLAFPAREGWLGKLRKTSSPAFWGAANRTICGILESLVRIVWSHPVIPILRVGPCRGGMALDSPRSRLLRSLSTRAPADLELPVGGTEEAPRHKGTKKGSEIRTSGIHLHPDL